MKGSKLIAVCLTATMLTACTEPNGAPGRGIENGGALSKADVGTAVGVVGGGIIGSTIGGGAGKVVAVLGGALLGGVLGNLIGGKLDDQDRASYDAASQRAMETGTTRNWSNSETGHHGHITPHHRYRNDEGQYCREYTQTIVVDGATHHAKGTACRESDGTWKIAE